VGLDKLVAIDIHTHAHTPPEFADPEELKQREAMRKYFGQKGEELSMKQVGYWYSDKSGRAREYVLPGAWWQRGGVSAFMGWGRFRLPISQLMFSNNANNSEEIKRELALASAKKLFVLPVRIENAEPTKGFKYQLATRQYIDLFEDREKSMALIVSTLQRHLQSIGNAN
jgi:hypothetical protein